MPIILKLICTVQNISYDHLLDWHNRSLTANDAIRANVQLGSKHGIPEAYVRKLAKKYCWIKGKPRKVMPPLAEVYKEGVKKSLSETIVTKKNSATLALMSIDLAERMLEELHQITTYPGELEALILAETADDRHNKRRNAMLKAVSLPTRASALKTIAQILVQAYGVFKY